MASPRLTMSMSVLRVADSVRLCFKLRVFERTSSKTSRTRVFSLFICSAGSLAVFADFRESRSKIFHRALRVSTRVQTTWKYSHVGAAGVPGVNSMAVLMIRQDFLVSFRARSSLLTFNQSSTSPREVSISVEVWALDPAINIATLNNST